MPDVERHHSAHAETVPHNHMAQPWVLSYRNPKKKAKCMLALCMYMDRLRAAMLQSAERGNLALHRVHTRCSLHTLQQL